MKKLFFLIPALLLVGCGHNAITYSDGIGVEMGFIPEQMQIAVNFRYGKIFSAVVKEQAEVKLSTDAGADAATDPALGARAKTELALKTGKQITGYAVDLAKIEAKKEAGDSAR